MWELQLSMSGVTDLVPVSRRRAYSDPRQKKSIKLPLRKRTGSPPHLRIKDSLCVPRPPGSPTSSGYGSCTTLPEGVQCQFFNAPLYTRGDTSYGDTSPRSPRSPHSSNIFAGIVVGSPLGSGPLNGTPLNNSGLSPVSETSVLSSSPSSGDSCLSQIDLHPLRRARLSSLSEVPSVAPIPENHALMDTPPRPRLRQEDLEPLPFAFDGVNRSEIRVSTAIN